MRERCSSRMYSSCVYVGVGDGCGRERGRETHDSGARIARRVLLLPPAPSPSLHTPTPLSHLNLVKLKLALQCFQAGVQVAVVGGRVVGRGRGRAAARARGVQLHRVRLEAGGAFDLHGGGESGGEREKETGVALLREGRDAFFLSRSDCRKTLPTRICVLRCERTAPHTRAPLVRVYTHAPLHTPRSMATAPPAAASAAPTAPAGPSTDPPTPPEHPYTL